MPSEPSGTPSATTRLHGELQTTLAALEELGPEYEQELTAALVERLHTTGRVWQAQPPGAAGGGRRDGWSSGRVAVVGGLLTVAALLLTGSWSHAAHRYRYFGPPRRIAVAAPVAPVAPAAPPAPPAPPAPVIPRVQFQ